MILKLPYPPRTGNTATRHARGRHYTPADLVAYRRHVALEVLRQVPAHERPLTGKVDLEILPTPPDRRRRDKENLVKPLNDALTHAGLWSDDSQVADLIVREWAEPDKNDPHVIVILTPS